MGQDTASPLEGFQLTHKPHLPRQGSNKVCLILDHELRWGKTRY